VKRTKIDDNFSRNFTHETRHEEPFENLKNNEEPPVVGPNDIPNQGEYTTSTPHSQALNNSPVEPPTLVDRINNPFFLEKDKVDDILMIVDVDDLCFTDEDPADDINKIT